jgi:hypothetical protein
MGDWHEVGQPLPPIPHEHGSFIVTTTVPGDGPVVAAGDLVKARAVVTTVDLGGNRVNPSPTVVWVWTGREPEVDSQHATADYYTFGSLGGERVRAALIGRKLHEQFEIHLEEGAALNTGNLPVHGIMDDPLSRLRIGVFIHGQLTGPLEWPELALRSEGGGNPSAQIEILEICPAAKLYRRTATLTQDGTRITVGDLKYDEHRKGTLGWTALDAQCPGPDGHIHIQAGPFYFFDIFTPGVLAAWSASYVRLRPPEQHPEEWRVPVQDPEEVINDRMAAITRRIQALEIQQQGYEFNCRELKKCEDPQKHEARRLERERLIQESVRQRAQLECELEKKCGKGEEGSGAPK